MPVTFLSPQELSIIDNCLILDATYFIKGGTEKAKERFTERSIPHSSFWDINSCADPHYRLPHMLAPEIIFAHFLAGSRWKNKQPICIYDQIGLFSAPRLAWEFCKREVDADIYLLAGGLPSWEAAGLPLTPGSKIIEPSTPNPDLWWQDSFVASYNLSEVFDELRIDPQYSAQIVDARSPGRFNGSEPEPREGLRGGHIPGSVNLPFSTVVKDGQFTDDFNLNGVDLSRPIVTTCGSGITAAGLALALEARGAEHVMVYDGSWSQWGDPAAMTPISL